MRENALKEKELNMMWDKMMTWEDALKLVPETFQKKEMKIAYLESQQLDTILRNLKGRVWPILM